MRTNPNEYVVDAHTVIWFMAGSSKLGAKAKSIMMDAESRFALPAVAFAEACWTIAKGRTQITSYLRFIDALDADLRFRILPLSRDIVIKTMDMPLGLEMHDRQIIATGLWLAEQGMNITLLTKDEAITRSGLIPIVW